MRKAPATRRQQNEAFGRDLFPPAWPRRAWDSFEPALLAAVYAKSGDLWQVLRDRCRGVTSWLQHLEYEGDVERDGRFDAATKLIPNWADTEASLQQARNLLGKQAWRSLVGRAATKSIEPPEPRRRRNDSAPTG